MEHLGAYLAVVSVFVFLSVATVAGIVGEYKRRALLIEPLRAAIERGQPLDSQLIERLMAPEPHGEALNPLYFKVAGIITVAAGTGIAGLAYFIAQVMPLALYPLLGVGLVAVCVGVGLLVAARVVPAAAADKPQPG
jgi:hypothetical protein